MQLQQKHQIQGFINDVVKEAANSPVKIIGMRRMKISRCSTFCQHALRERSRMRNVTTLLPQDLIHAEILPRLPAKYVLRFRLVCKSWNSLFSTSGFVNSHLTHQLHDSEEKDRIIVKRFGLNEVVNILSRTDLISVRRVPCVFDTLIGSINGLVAIYSERGERFCLWNPAIGHVRFFDFPPPHLHDECEVCGYFLGFCWDHVKNDYKVFMFCYDPQTTPLSQLCIYSTNSATWTVLRIPHNVLLPEPIHDYWSLPAGPSTFVKGTPYWSSSKSLTLPGKKRRRKFFYAIKFVPEINELRILPDLDSLKIRANNFDIVNIKDRLVGMAYKLVECGETLVDMYSLDNEDSNSAVWSKMYTIGPVYFGRSERLSQCFRNGGEILIRGYSGPFAFYDPKTKETKSIAVTPSNYLIQFTQCYSFTPSLVCVRGMESCRTFSQRKDSRILFAL